MSGPEVLGAMSALTAIVRASIDLYGAIQKDLRLPEAFSVVQWQLPIILASLKTAEQHLKAVQDAISTDAWDALEEYVVTCKDKADRLKQIFEKVLPASNDTWKDKYKKMLKRFGKGSLVEELMLAITEDVKLLRKHHALATTNPEQREQLDTTVEELKNVGSSLDDGEQASGMRFDSGGGKMENYINQRDGNQVINHGTVTNQNFGEGN